MAYLAVNKDGTEVIGNSLVRARQMKYHIDRNGVRLCPLDKHKSKLYYDIWADLINTEDDDYNAAIELPKGTIKKLIGVEMTWEDDAVELK